MTLDEAIEALRERRVDSSVARLLNTVDEVIAAYDAERILKMKLCEPWCHKQVTPLAAWAECSLACNEAGRPVNPKVTP
jgi:hypothetical protein